MPTGSRDGAMALARDAMDRALAAPNGVRITFLDAEHGSKANAAKAVKAWTSRVYAARSAMRQTQARAATPADLINGMTATATDPDAFRTAYDPLYCVTDRTPADDGWRLSILRASADTLAMEVI